MHRILVLEEIPVRYDDVDQDDNEEAEAQPRHPPNGRLVSQTDVIKFLLEHNHKLGSVLDTTAEQMAGHALRYAQDYLDSAAAVQLKQTPASITINCVAWTALQTMSTSQASCVAIVGKVLRLKHDHGAWNLLFALCAGTGPLIATSVSACTFFF